MKLLLSEIAVHTGNICSDVQGAWTSLVWTSRSVNKVRAGPAFLQFDWSKAGLSMDLPVLVYSHTKISFKFFSRQEDIGQLFMWLHIFLLQTTQRETYRALVLSKLKYVKVY